MAKAKEEVVEAPVAKESEAKKEFRKLMAIYKEQNPSKYAVKEEALLKKLETL